MRPAAWAAESLGLVAPLQVEEGALGRQKGEGLAVVHKNAPARPT